MRLAVLTACLLGLYAWWPIGYYQDEFIYRLLNARYIQDQSLRMGIYSLCESWLSPFPQFLAVQAWLVSFLYHSLLPHEVRLVVFAVMAIFFGLIALNGRLHSNLYLLGALVGVAGSSLLYSRPEFLHILNLTCCLAGYLLLQAPDFKWKAIAQWLCASLILLSCLISSYAHMQGVLYLPLNLLCLFLLLRKHIMYMMLAMIIAVSSGIVAYQAAQQALACNSAPQVALHTRQLSHAIADLPDILASKQVYEKLHWYAVRFLYKDKYSVEYLPGLKVSSWHTLLNLLVGTAVVLNLFLALCLTVKLLVQLALQLSTKGIGTITQQHSLQLFIFLILSPTLGLFLINAGQTFYRNFFIHAVLAATIAFYYSRNNQKPQRWFKVLSFYFAIVFNASLTTNLLYFYPQFMQGYSGWYAVPMVTEKKFMQQPIPDQCHFDAKAGKLVVDMLAYELMKHYPYLYPYEYLSIQSKLTGKSHKEILQPMQMQGYAFACQNKQGELHLCCGKFPANSH